MKGQWGKLVGYVLVTAIVSTAATLLLPLIGGGGWLPDLISSEGSAIDLLFWGMTAMSIAIFAIVGGLVLYSMVHFRAAPGDLSDGEHIHGNAKMEAAWIIIPTIIVTIVGVLSFIVLEDNEIGLFDEAQASAPGAATMVVDVRGYSFGWEFRHLDLNGKPLGGDEAGPSSAELVLPVDEIVKFDVMSCSGKEHLGRVREETLRTLAAHGDESEFAEIEPGLCEKHWDLTTPEDREAVVEQTTLYYTAKQKQQDGTDLTEEEQLVWDEKPRFQGDKQYMDVNHAFWVPEARLKIDAVAGLRTYVQWQATRVTLPDDRFQVVCAELCGSGHNAMRTDMCVVDAPTFEWWAKLDEEGRRDANCMNLRLMSCLGNDVGERGETLTAIAAISKEDPEATCGDVEETAA
jgi:heme/copper-type cytochrome/quinol oxidase subunit 2